MTPLEPVVPLSALEHYLYCPRQCALIHVDGLWFDNEHTVRGQRGHRRADFGPDRTERGKVVLRAVPLWSEQLGLSGRADVVELDDAAVVPVEYKIGTRHGDAAHVQLCAQALCLEEMLGCSIPFGALWFSGPRRRVPVAIDGPLRRTTLDVVAAIRSDLAAARLPHAANDERCAQCQFLDHCQPELCAAPARVQQYLAREVFACAS